MDEEKIIIKGKTNNLICVLLGIIIILVSTVINTKIYDSIPNHDATSIIAKIWFYFTIFYIFIFIFTIMFFKNMACSNINVTDKKIFGKTVWKNFDISYKEIVNIKLIPLKGISIKTNYNIYKIYFLKNNEDIYNKLDKNINKKQK